jgi:hypothetical protein
MDPQPKGQCGARRKQTGRGYGVGQPLGVGALEYVPNNTSNVVKPIGGRRRSKKKTKKGTKGGKKTAGRRGRTARGGGSIGTVGYGYAGSGSRGLADPVGYVANPPTPNGGYPMKYTQ